MSGDPLVESLSSILRLPTLHTISVLEAEKDTIYIVETPSKHAWITPTCIRNHTDVVAECFQTSSRGVREWKRYGLIIAIDWDPRKGDPDTQSLVTKQVPIL